MKNTAQKTLTLIPIAIALIAVIVFTFIGNIRVDFGDEELILGATLTKSTAVKYSEILNVEFRESIKAGDREFGIGNMKIAAGDFKNDEFGKYKLYAYGSVAAFVVAETEDGYVVFNCDSVEKTQSAYEKLIEKMGE